LILAPNGAAIEKQRHAGQPTVEDSLFAKPPVRSGPNKLAAIRGRTAEQHIRASAWAGLRADEPFERPLHHFRERQIVAGSRRCRPHFARRKPVSELGHKRPRAGELDDNLETPFMAGLRLCPPQFARRKAAVEQGERRAWLIKLDVDLDRRLLAEGSADISIQLMLFALSRLSLGGRDLLQIR